MSSKSRAIIGLEGALGVREAKSTKQRLEQAIAASTAIEIDVSNLSGIDIATLQLLISARRSAEKLGKTLTISGESKIFEEFLVQSGLMPPGGEHRAGDCDFALGAKRAERDAA